MELLTETFSWIVMQIEKIPNVPFLILTILFLLYFFKKGNKDEKD